MIALYSVLKEGNIMNELSLPLSKSGLFMSKDLSITN
jgi:hypothetical protein